MTPRPDLPPGMGLPRQLGPQGTAKFATALTKRRWHSASCCMVFSDLALSGAHADQGVSAAHSGPACLDWALHADLECGTGVLARRDI